jgi:hypothetical protein
VCRQQVDIFGLALSFQLLEVVKVCIGCPRNSVDMEFRLFFLLPSIPYSVRNWLKFQRNSANSVSYNSVKFRGISQNYVTFYMYGIPYISKKTKIKVSSVFFVIFWFRMYIPTVHDKFSVLKIEIQYNLLKINFLFKGEFGIWIILLHANFRMQIHTEFREIQRNSGKFYCKKYRGISRNSVCISKNSVFRRKSKTHFRGHPRCA